MAVVREKESEGMVGHCHGSEKTSGHMMLYLDPWTGVSGDMMLAALLDIDREGDRLAGVLTDAVAGLGLGEDVVEIVRDVERGVACTRVLVRDGGAGPHRHLSDMLEVIGEASLSDRVRERSSLAVRRLAEAEAAVHGCGVEEIHFHEVGGVDTLVDVVGTFVLVEALGIERVGVGVIPVGGGTVEIAHGRMGVPAPATAFLLRGFPISGGPEMRELTTPTGALLVGCLEARGGVAPAMEIESVGYGAGTMKLEHGPNVLRAIVGRSGGGGRPDPRTRGDGTIVELQSNIDDVTPEVVGHACLRLREAGALDVWTVAAHMKKDRPGVVLHCLVAPERETEVVDRLFAETGTLGVRRQEVDRYVAERGTVMVEAGGREVAVKWGRRKGRLVSLAPEFEDAARVAAETGIPLRDIMHEAKEAARTLTESGHLLP